jgi:hypothetical protein
MTEVLSAGLQPLGVLHVFAFHADGSPVAGWPASIPDVVIYYGSAQEFITEGSDAPAVADVDHDGNAEIVVCSDRMFGGTIADTGIFVIEDANDTWVDTRRIWNQHSYHVTNVNDDSTIPAQETSSWQMVNTYRQNASDLSCH